MAVEDIPSKIEFPATPPVNERVQFYQNEAQKLLDKYGKDFDKFVEKQEILINKGDALLRNCQCTGYNLILSEENMALSSELPQVFYCNYIGRPKHFGLLLAEIERDKIITPSQVKFGTLASKVRFNELEGWNPDKKDEKIKPFDFTSNGESLKNGLVDQSIQTVITFSPINADNAFQIVKKLLARVDSTRPGFIEDSWQIPDIRATANLRKTLVDTKIGLAEVQANILPSGRAQLITLRDQTRFVDTFPEESWTSIPTGLNKRMVEFLIYFGVPG